MPDLEAQSRFAKRPRPLACASGRTPLNDGDGLVTELLVESRRQQVEATKTTSAQPCRRASSSAAFIN